MLSFLLGSLVVLYVYHSLTPKPPEPPEKVPAPETFSQKVDLINRVIENQLEENGLSKKNVLLHQSSLRKDKEGEWEQSFLKIRIPSSASSSILEKNFKDKVSQLGKAFSVQSVRKRESLRLEITVKGRMTHQLSFIPSQPASPVSPHRARVAIVIDDLGQDQALAEELLRWDSPITFSVLPFAAHSKTLVEEAHRRHKEVILHLPMEPQGYPGTNPGPGALLHEMDNDQLLRQLSDDIEAVPYIAGVSNHMGSLLMEDKEKIKVILSELKRRGLFFLDSRTTSQSAGFQIAHAMGMRAAERDVFLDHSVEEKAIRRSLERLVQISLSSGKAVGIGHPHPETIQVLKEMIPKMKAKGIDIVPLSDLLD